MHRLHRFVVPCLAAVIAFASARASASEPKSPEPKSPPSLAAALEDWIVLLEKDDLKTARDRWAGGAEAAEAMAREWKQLKACHKEFNYRTWIDRAAPAGADPTRFTVGGHEYGHRHVIWHKTDKGWRVGEIQLCR